eukprot:Selendium_serpulae@DN4932_c0_g1_i1.p3
MRACNLSRSRSFRKRRVAFTQTSPRTESSSVHCRDSSIDREKSDCVSTWKRRTNTRFSLTESEWLKEGINRFGEGKWSKILKSYPFLKCRTTVDLKDKWRNIKKRL